MARAATGRSVVLRFNGHYHGWVDNIYSRDGGSQAAPASPGQAQSALRDVLTIEWNDTEASECAVSARAEDLAAVIMEPVMVAAAMAAGYPCAAIAGRRDLFAQVATGEVTHAGTLHGNVIAAAAVLASLGELASGEVYQRSVRSAPR